MPNYHQGHPRRAVSIDMRAYRRNHVIESGTVSDIPEDIQEKICPLLEDPKVLRILAKYKID